jgi:starch-binding outer membrane protein, SusD/RagB family
MWQRSFAKLVPATSNFTGAAAELTGTNAPDAIWQLFFSNTDQSQYAFYWYPSPGGRNEFDPASSMAAAHPAGDKRLPINVVPATTDVTVAGQTYTLRTGTTQKYYRTSTRDDAFNIVRYAEMVLTVAEAAAQTGDLATALAQNNIIRVRAGLLPLVIGTPPAPTTPPTAATAVYITPTAADPTGQAALLRDILLQRRLELAYEGHQWFDLRRTDRVQSTLGTVAPAAPNAYNQSFRNLFPIPQREVTLTNGLIAQNPGF